MDSLYQILFSSVTVQHFQQTLTTHACRPEATTKTSLSMGTFSFCHTFTHENFSALTQSRVHVRLHNQSLDSGDTPVRCFLVLYYSLTSSLWDNQIIDRMDDLRDICKLRLTCCMLL